MNEKRLISIRGAITAQNNAQSISTASRRLIDKLYFKNGLTDDDVVNIIISTTADITAFYPARAIRESGHIAPLFSCVEPNIDGAISGCIRVMVTAYGNRDPFNVYLNGARALRPDLCGVYSIALDGPSGAGKSTVAKTVAKRLGITYLDTGALYRALGLKLLSCGVSVSDENAAKECLKNVVVSIKYSEDGAQHVLLDGEDVSGRIRTPEVSMAASACSALPYVRQKLLGLQRDIAKGASVILDGRDIGSAVLPNSEFKYYLTASPEVRAKRRFDELKAKGEGVSFDAVLADIIQRDKNDSTRAVNPLTKVFDAREIDSSEMSADEVAQAIINEVTEDVQ